MVIIMKAKEMVKILIKQTIELYADGVKYVNIDVQPITKNYNTRCQNELNTMSDRLCKVYDNSRGRIKYEEYMILQRAIISVKHDLANAVIRK